MRPVSVWCGKFTDPDLQGLHDASSFARGYCASPRGQSYHRSLGILTGCRQRRKIISLGLREPVHLGSLPVVVGVVNATIAKLSRTPRNQSHQSRPTNDMPV
jgi:hypothetical protein